MEYLVAFNGALAILEKVAPIIRKQFAGVTVTPEEQTAVRDAYLEFRAKGDAAFTGPEWDIEK